MPESKITVDGFLAEARALDDRRQALIADIIKQRESALRAFDAELARLGYEGEGKRRNHHKKGAPKPVPEIRKAA